ncbi:hypothetical protein BKI52_12455 [marine bacterium AO1-C]|nr:hypothetical protein BKI52_12455 [marine bacterium AO1-C]
MIQLLISPYTENKLFSTPQLLEIDSKGINYKIKNPIFEDELKQASASEQFTLPMGRNSILLNHPERFGSKAKSLYDVSLKIGNQGFANSKMLYDHNSSKGHKVRVISDLAGISNELGSQTLKQFLQDESPHVVVDAQQDPYAVINASSDKVRFPRVYLPNFFGEEQTNSNFEGWVNDTLHSRGAQFGLEATLVPMFRVSYLIRRILEKMGYSVNGSFFNDPEIQNVCLLGTHNIPIDLTTVGLNNRVVINDHSQHVPANVKVYDFLKAVQQTFCLDFDFAKDNKAININFRSDLLNSTEVLDWTNKVAGIEENATEDRYYNFGFKSPSNENTEKWANDPFAKNFTSFRESYPQQSIGQNNLASDEKSITIPMQPLRFEGITTSHIGDVNVIGSSKDPNLKPSGNEKITFLFYIGNGQPGPTANSSSSVGFNYSFALDEYWTTKTIFRNEKIWGNWLQFLTNTRRLELYLDLAMSDITNLNPKKHKIRIENREYLLKELRFTMPNTQVSKIACQAELLQLPIL